MGKFIINESQLRTIFRKKIVEQSSDQQSDRNTDNKEQIQKCLTTNTIPLDHIVGLSDGYDNYASKLYKRSGGIRGMVDALDILKTLRLHPDIGDAGEHISYDLMNHLDTFRNKNYYDETNGNCHKAFDKVIELYKENEHGEDLVKDIEKVLGHPDPSPRAKEYLKRCLELAKGK